MKVLVTGGAGYIGSVVAPQIAEAGHEDAAGLAEVFAGGYDGVPHFAALSLVGESAEQPGRYCRANVAGTLNLLEAMRNAGLSRLVFSSTAAVYGEPEEPPIPDTARPVRPAPTAAPSPRWTG